MFPYPTPSNKLPTKWIQIFFFFFFKFLFHFFSPKQSVNHTRNTLSKYIRDDKVKISDKRPATCSVVSKLKTIIYKQKFKEN